MMALVVCSVDNRDCMLHHCDNCPDDKRLHMSITSALGYENYSYRGEYDSDEIVVSQWVSTDRCEIRNISFSCEQLLDECVRQITNLTKHSYIAKAQEDYLKHRKINISKDEAIVLLDFSENFQFVIQNEVQSYHWCKDYCTVHCLVVYLKNNNHDLVSSSFCIISDDLTHDIAFVWCSQKAICQFPNEKFPDLTKVKYFSDGCAGQYKNYKILQICAIIWKISVCHHHGRFLPPAMVNQPCDGVGGVVKR